MCGGADADVSEADEKTIKTTGNPPLRQVPGIIIHICENNLLPFNSSRWFRGNVIDDAVNIFNLINNTVR